jgi:hypothetical protein
MGYINLPVEGGGGGGAWGDITGTLSAQTDLQAALDAKDTILDPAVNPDLYFIFQTDFTDNSRAGLTVAASAGGGTGQATSEGTTGVNSTENCLGVLDMALGTGTTARMTILGSPWLRIGSQILDYGTRLAYSVLSDGTNTYTTWIGFMDTTGAGIGTNGIMFRYTHSVNSGKWQAVTLAGGVVTAADTGVAPSATVNQALRIVVNQAGTQALFYIDGTLTNTVSSGLPATSAQFYYGNKIEKSAGTTSVTMTTDWLYFKSTRTTAR